MSGQTPGTNKLKDEMNVAAASVTKLISASQRAGLSKEAAALAALIGAISAIRVDGLDEELLLKEARKAVPPSLPRIPNQRM